MKWFYNWKLFFWGTFIVFLIVDVIGEGIMVIGLLMGWLIGLMTMNQWNMKKFVEDNVPVQEEKK